MTGTRVQPDHGCVFELAKESERVAGGGQQHVAAVLVRCRLDGDAHPITPMDDVLAH